MDSMVLLSLATTLLNKPKRTAKARQELSSKATGTDYKSDIKVLLRSVGNSPVEEANHEGKIDVRQWPVD
jgi:hypothetical protein